MSNPEWVVNVVGPDYADISEGQASIAVYDYAVSTSTAVYAETVIATDAVEDDWYDVEQLESGDCDLSPTMLATVRRVFESAENATRPAPASAGGSGVQGRVGRGVPAGGQFASVDRAEAAVSLT